MNGHRERGVKHWVMKYDTKNYKHMRGRAQTKVEWFSVHTTWVNISKEKIVLECVPVRISDAFFSASTNTSFNE